MNKLLVIDSDVAATQVIQAALAPTGIQISATADGGDGLAQARLNRPDCVILCVELMRGSGYSVCNKLRKDPQIADLPLILVSQEATEETFEQHRKLKTHADHYLKKPYDVPALLKVLGHYYDLQALGTPAGGHTTQAAPLISSAPSFSPTPSTPAWDTTVQPLSDEHTAALDVAGPMERILLPRRQRHADAAVLAQLPHGDDDADNAEPTRVVHAASMLKQATAWDAAAAQHDHGIGDLRGAADKNVAAAEPHPLAVMDADETHTYAVTAPTFVLPREVTRPPTIRASVQQAAHRGPSRGEGASGMGAQQGSNAPLELLPDAIAEQRAAFRVKTEASDRVIATAVSAKEQLVAPLVTSSPNFTPVAGVDPLQQEIVELRHELQQSQQACRRAVTQLEAAHAALAEAEHHRLELMHQHKVLTDEHRALQTSYTGLGGQMATLYEAHASLQGGQADTDTLAAWQQARQVVADTLHLIDKTGLVSPV